MGGLLTRDEMLAKIDGFVGLMVRVERHYDLAIAVVFNSILFGILMFASLRRHHAKKAQRR